MVALGPVATLLRPEAGVAGGLLGSGHRPTYFPRFFVVLFPGVFASFFTLAFVRIKLPGFCAFACFDPLVFAIVGLLAPAEKESAAPEEQHHDEDDKQSVQVHSSLLMCLVSAAGEER